MLYFSLKKRKVITIKSRRYNPRRLAFVIYTARKAGYTPAFLTLTAPHKKASTSEEKKKFNKDISRAYWFFANEYLPKCTGKAFFHYIRRAEEHATGHFHYHLLIADWQFTIDDYANIRFAWVKALHRVGLLSDGDLEKAHKYANLWRYRKDFGKEVYELGQSFSGFIKVEMLPEDDEETASVASYVSSYISDDEDGGRMRGYGIFHRLTEMHSVLVFLHRYGYPTPEPTSPPEEWQDFWQELQQVIAWLVALRIEAKQLSPSISLLRVLKKAFKNTYKYTPEKGHTLRRTILQGKITPHLLRWLHLRRLSTGEKDTDGYTEEERALAQELISLAKRKVITLVSGAKMLYKSIYSRLSANAYSPDALWEAHNTAKREYLKELHRIFVYLSEVQDAIFSFFSRRPRVGAYLWWYTNVYHHTNVYGKSPMPYRPKHGGMVWELISEGIEEIQNYILQAKASLLPA